MNQNSGFAALLCVLLCAACGDEGTPANTSTEPDTGGRPTGDVGTIPDDDTSSDAAADATVADVADVGSDASAPEEDTAVTPDDAVDGGDPDAASEDDTAIPDTVAPDASGVALGGPCESNAECASGLCIDTTGGAEPGICSTACESDADCSADYSCYSLTLEGVAVLGVCLPASYCSDPDEDGYGKGPGCLGEDCQEGAPDIYPGAAELCDGLDNDCNERVDDAVTGLAASCSTAELGLCAVGAEQCVDGAPVCVPGVSPAAEVCDGLDNDCDGEPDDGLTCTELTPCERVYGGYWCRTAGEFSAPVPPGSRDITILAWGAGGAGGSQGGGTGGGGGYVRAFGDAAGFDTLRVLVGEGGRAENGGGGASYVYHEGSLLVVAGGGGGGASDGCSGCWNGGAGGAGGGVSGQAGQGGTPSSPGSIIFGTPSGGGGGTATAGGAPGSTAGSSSGSTCLSDGTAGGSGMGGNAGGGGPDCNRGGGGGMQALGGAAGWGNGGGGGGGSGWFGGGGGGGRYTYYGGGGGGGSSWVNAAAFTGGTELLAGERQVPGDAVDNEFYLGENARGGDRGTSRDATTAGKPGVVVILFFPPPWF